MISYMLVNLIILDCDVIIIYQNNINNNNNNHNNNRADFPQMLTHKLSHHHLFAT